jgi:hypothetical protein
MSDRLIILASMLRLGLLLDANVSYQRPYDLLKRYSDVYSDRNWDTYIDVYPSFHGYNASIPQPICINPIDFTEKVANELLKRPVLPRSFCYHINFYFYKAWESWFGKFLTDLNTTFYDNTTASQLQVRINPSLAAVKTAQQVLTDLNIDLSKGDTFGMIKIRHYYNGTFQMCTAPHLILNDWRRFVHDYAASHGSTVTNASTGATDSHQHHRSLSEINKNRMFRADSRTHVYSGPHPHLTGPQQRPNKREGLPISPRQPIREERGDKETSVYSGPPPHLTGPQQRPNKRESLPISPRQPIREERGDKETSVYSGPPPHFTGPQQRPNKQESLPISPHQPIREERGDKETSVYSGPPPHLTGPQQRPNKRESLPISPRQPIREKRGDKETSVYSAQQRPNKRESLPILLHQPIREERGDKETSVEVLPAEPAFIQSVASNPNIPKVWIIAADVAPDYFKDLLRIYAFGNKQYSHFIHKIITENQLTVRGGKMLVQEVPDNYFVIRVIRHLMMVANFSIGTHWYEGNKGYSFCENWQDHNAYYEAW